MQQNCRAAGTAPLFFFSLSLSLSLSLVFLSLPCPPPSRVYPKKNKILLSNNLILLSYLSPKKTQFFFLLKKIGGQNR
jgi:hypothetical protein